MGRLGHQHYVAQGGDWVAAVTQTIGAMRPSGCLGLHLNTLSVAPRPGAETDSDPEKKAVLALMRNTAGKEFGYARQQSNRPQTTGYGLADSPAGQAAWIYEKYRAWSDPSRAPEASYGMDGMLDNIMLYWLTNTGASSARLYWESLGSAGLSDPIEIPVGVSLFPSNITAAPRRWAERFLHDIVHWKMVERGGHFGAFEEPEIFVRELRESFRRVHG